MDTIKHYKRQKCKEVIEREEIKKGKNTHNYRKKVLMTMVTMV